MLSLLLTCLVVFCGIYCVVWIVTLVLGLLKVASFPPANPLGPGTIISFMVALTIWIVFGHGFGSIH